MAVQGGYGKSLKWVLKHSQLTGLVVLGTIALSVWLYISIPKTFFPEQDTGVLMGGIQADQSISFQAMRGKLQDFMKIIREDPVVDNVTGFTGGSRVNSGMMFITPQAARPAPRDGAAGDRPAAQKLANEPGANLFLMAVQDIRVGGRQSNASYQYTLLSGRPVGAARVGSRRSAKRWRRCRSWRTSTRINRTMAPKWTWSMTGIPCRARHQRPGRQQPAEQRLWPAADLYHLPAAQPV